MENLLIFMFETNFFLKNVVNQKHVCGAPRLRDLRSRRRPLGHEVPLMWDQDWAGAARWGSAWEHGRPAESVAGEAHVLFLWLKPLIRMAMKKEESVQEIKTLSKKYVEFEHSEIKNG